jgi:response regulator RpfG family c-di-GMP phosphodiesterase
MWSNKGAPAQSASNFLRGAETTAATMPETTAKPPTILVVDDDAEIRYSLTRVLSSRRYHIIEAPSGEAGIAMVKKGPPPTSCSWTCAWAA